MICRLWRRVARWCAPDAAFNWSGDVFDRHEDYGIRIENGIENVFRGNYIRRPR